MDRSSTCSDLDAAEEVVCEIMRNTTATLEELQKTPHCDQAILSHLAEEFAGLVGTVNSLLCSTEILKAAPELSIEESKRLGEEEFSKNVAELKELIDSVDKKSP